MTELLEREDLLSRSSARSLRTVDHQVSAIHRKLHMRTRGEAAAAAAQPGLLQDR